MHFFIHFIIIFFQNVELRTLLLVILKVISYLVDTGEFPVLNQIDL